MRVGVRQTMRAVVTPEVLGSAAHSSTVKVE